MTAGLFAQHGVFFGKCMPPAPFNAKGFFENLWFKRVLLGRQHFSGSITSAWLQQRRREGWADGQPWGLKFGANYYACGPEQLPDVMAIVCCYRPKAQIHGSRAALGWSERMQTVESCWEVMDRLLDTDARAVRVRTDRLAAGDIDQIRPAFARLGVELDESIARDWIDPDLWHHRGDDAS